MAGGGRGAMEGDGARRARRERRAGDSSGDSGGRPREPGRFRVRGVIPSRTRPKIEPGPRPKVHPARTSTGSRGVGGGSRARDKPPEGRPTTPPHRCSERSSMPPSALLLAGGLLGAWAVVAGRPAPSEQELPGPRPVPVRTVLLAPRDGPQGLPAIGTLKARGLLAPELGGRRGGRCWPRRRCDPARGRAPGADRRPARRAGTRGRAHRAPGRQGAPRDGQDPSRARCGPPPSRRSPRSSCAPRRSAGVGAGESERPSGRGSTSPRARASPERWPSRTRARLEERERSRRRRGPGGGARRPADRAAGGPPRPARGPCSVRRRVRALAGRLWPPARGRPGADPGRPAGALVDLNELQLVCDVHVDDAASLHLGARAVAAPAGRPGLLLEGHGHRRSAYASSRARARCASRRAWLLRRRAIAAGRRRLLQGFDHGATAP